MKANGSGLIFILALAAAVAAFPGGISAQDKCAALAGFQIPGTALEITGARNMEEAVSKPSPFGGYQGTIPGHCRVDGVIDKRTGSDGKPYAIGFAVALPDNWNGRFLFQGGGGLNGSVGNPLGAQAAGDTPALARGFAVVSTDSGHQGSGAFDSSFMSDQEAVLNFLYKAIGKVTVAAKEIVREYYSRPPDYSYYVGCSTGGREAMIVSQRYPDYFDGVVAGAPAMRTNFSNLADRYVAVTLNQAAPLDENGDVVPGGGFSDSDKKLIVDSFLDACDAKDGIADEMVFNIQGCDFDPSDIVCRAEKKDDCLTAKKADVLKKAFAGPVDSRGHQVYPGFYFDTGIAASRGLPGLLNATGGPVGPPFTESEMDVDAASVAAADAIAAVGDSTWTHLSTFAAGGGKLIFFHGLSDPWFSALDTQEYYQKMAEENGGLEKVLDWSRLFLVPGMGHCSGGEKTLDQFNMLEAIVNWVEKDVPPESVEVSGRAFPGRTRPLCPFPSYAYYTGDDDSENAAGFECRNPD
ncbi:MAG: tannase/feruloyl esterase family alpha/beta hydrolase [Acidobacteria bacterium]|nr:tannase/feruloyl esterase family alpha/beta hydrolase [Acidobacteriota bacterium]